MLGCDSSLQKKELTIQENAEKIIKAEMNDPDSFEFDKLILLDSVTYKQNIDYWRAVFELRTQLAEKALQKEIGFKTTNPRVYKEEYLQIIKDDISQKTSIVARIDSVEFQNQGNLNDVAIYTYLYRFRANNVFGGKILNSYIIQVGGAPHFQIMGMEKSGKDVGNYNSLDGESLVIPALQNIVAN